ncbi:TlpA family protein disulfide reductase [bacterium]|nr:TlpA family protein disulfide reductase [bacterium]MCI0605499.1 TlpA family protein disulfide reductase [bacterium]
MISFPQCSKPNLPQVGQQAPEFTLKNLKGEKVKLQVLTQKGMVLVNFAASWCAPCKQEAARLNWIHQRGLTVVSIFVEDPAPAVISFMKKHNVQYPVLLDSEGRVARRYGFIDFPTNILINEQGKIHFLKTGIIDEKMVAAIMK